MRKSNPPHTVLRSVAAALAALVVHVAGTAHAAAAAPAPAGARRPNVVLIVADDLGWNGVGYHGGFVRTPHIDRIAKQGVELDRFYVSPMCSPTRAGLMTGRYPMRYGMARSVVRPWARFGLPPAERTLPEALADAGYARRGAFGKWHLGHLGPQWHPLNQGFTRFEGCYNGAADYFTRQRDGQVDWHVDGQPADKPGYTTDLIADAAVAFIAEHAAVAAAAAAGAGEAVGGTGAAPFFCYVPFTAPHDPFQAPDAYLKQYAHLDDQPGDGRPSDKQTLAAMIACMDDGIGRILAAVERAGAARDTLVWFTSDNGGIGRIPGNNGPLRAAKLTVYEGGVRVPAAVWWPGVIEGGRKVDAPVLNLDVMPTLLALAGATVAATARGGEAGAGGPPLDGVDVSGLLTGRGPAPAARDLYFFTGQGGLETEEIAVTATDGWKLVVRGPDVRRAGGYRTAAHRVELFNLAEDPSEKADRAADRPEVVARLGEKVVAFRRQEPAESLPPMNRPPRGFEPPPQWRNTSTTRPAAAAVP